MRGTFDSIGNPEIAPKTGYFLFGDRPDTTQLLAPSAFIIADSQLSKKFVKHVQLLPCARPKDTYPQIVQIP